MKKKILVTAATIGEMKVIKGEIKNLSIRDIKVDFLLLGVGNYSTIYNLQDRVINNKYSFILNIGVCGYSGKTHPNSLLIGEGITQCIQVSRIKNLSNTKELIVPTFFKIGDLESIACSEQIVFDSVEIGEEKFVDMESYGVEFVCDKLQIPRILLKIPVDKIGEETKNFDFEKAKTLLAENIDYKKLLENISDYLEKNTVVTTGLLSLQKYQDYYKMTFSEKLIFEKLYNKYKVLVEEEEGGKTFEDFFEENHSLSKKKFFQELQDIS